MTTGSCPLDAAVNEDEILFTSILPHLNYTVPFLSEAHMVSIYTAISGDNRPYKSRRARVHGKVNRLLRDTGVLKELKVPDGAFTWSMNKPMDVWDIRGKADVDFKRLRLTCLSYITTQATRGSWTKGTRKASNTIFYLDSPKSDGELFHGVRDKLLSTSSPDDFTAYLGLASVFCQKLKQLKTNLVGWSSGDTWSAFFVPNAFTEDETKDIVQIRLWPEFYLANKEELDRNVIESPWSTFLWETTFSNDFEHYLRDLWGTTVRADTLHSVEIW